MSEKNYDPTEHEPLPEGTEAPPPLTHTMAIIRWAILIAMSLFALGMILSWIGFAPWEAHADSTVQYHCPMHPTYISNQPGECPICGMSLVPIDKSGKEIKATQDSKSTKAKTPDKITKSTKMANMVQYTCPMHPEVITDKPGKCPKCGMNLVAMTPEKKSQAPKEAVIQAALYVCPMDPEVTSDKPGSCSKCGMDLVKSSGSDSTVAPSSITTGNNENKPAEIISAKYVCPMDPEITSDKPGRCSKCGMFLKAAATDTTKSMPMPNSDPEKTGDIGDQSMPGMNMSGSKETSSMGEAPVNGLAPVTIEPERLQLIGVKTAMVARRNLGGEINIVGSVTPDETRMKNINARVNGWVQDLYVDKTGQYVEAGKPLLSLYSQELYQAEQDFILARDAAKGNPSDPALTNMRNQIYKAAKDRLMLLGLSDDQINEIDNSDAPRQDLTLTSPFSGFVIEKNVLPGQYLSPDQNLFTIADLSKVWIMGDVYEQDISSVHVGQKAVAHLTAFPGEEFEGTIGYIYPELSEQTHTMKVRIEFANPANRIRPGMYANVNLESSKGEMLSVPSDAVLDGGKEQYVFVVHDRIHFEPRLVKIGHTSDDYIEITSGLREGETVVSSANFLIDSESRLNAAVAGMSTMPDMPDMPKTNQGTSK